MSMTRAASLDRWSWGFGDLKARFSHMLAERLAYESTVAELSRLSDRDLADLGIARCDIPTLARQAAEEEAR